MKSTCALILLAACAASPAPTTESPSSVHARLTAEPTSLFVPTTLDAGVLAAEHYTTAGWQSGSAAISIASGEVVIGLDDDANVVASTFDLSFAPIDVPESVFGSPAQLTNVRLQLPAPATAAIAWSDADDATATVPLVLSLSWSLSVNGGTLPLGAQTLPSIPLDVALGGDGDTVSASLALHGSGELWQWADLLKLTELELAATADTAATE
jgi:hypothetical protein